MQAAGITALGQPVEILEVDELAPPGADEVLIDVAAAGSGVAEVREGDEVMTHPLPLRRHGTWSRRVLAPAATVAPRPPEASWEAGGAFPIPALTAAQALDEALGIESGGWGVVNGARGGTGGPPLPIPPGPGAPR